MEKLADFYREGEFKTNLYFFAQFNCIPSHLGFSVSVERNRENVEALLQRLHEEDHAFKIIRKEWQLSHEQDFAEGDFTDYYLLRSEETHLCIEMKCKFREPRINFWYDHTIAGLEEWILEVSRRLRTKFVREEEQSFSVLDFSRGHFSTRDITINDHQLNVEQNYNDDFRAVHDIIDSSLQEKKSGLILLHGEPGTGKTTYIKHLMGKHREQEFIFIPNDYVGELLKPQFITFLINHESAILVIEDAEKVILSRENTRERSVVSTILQLTDGLFSDYLNIKVVCTFNTNKSKIDQALFRKGRMIAFYEFKALTAEKASALLEETVTEPMTLAEVYHRKEMDFKSKKAGAIGFKR